MSEKFDLKNISKTSLQVIGSELKRRRLISSKTLEDSRCGCSVSYLSKIENGKITPKYNILCELCEEQGITNEELECLINIDESIKECIEYKFWDNNKKIHSIYEKILNFDNYKANFIKVFYELSFMHWENVKNYLMQMNVIKNVFDEDDRYLYYYLQMVYGNYSYDYPLVYELYSKIKSCKNEYLLALASKELFISVCMYGVDNPIYSYENYYKQYSSLLNYSTKDMYELLIETYVKLGYELPESIEKELEDKLKLEYLLTRPNDGKLDEFIKNYRATPYEKLLIYTYKKEYAIAERWFKKLPLNKMSVRELIIASYCDAINRGDKVMLADYIIDNCIPYAISVNDGYLFKMFLKKLSEVAFLVGKYKAVASINMTYFEMIGKCKRCML